MTYYSEKKKQLEKIFGSKITVGSDYLLIHETGKKYQIQDKVIICDSSLLVEALDVQKSFGEEWQAFNFIGSEHLEEFDRYFDLVKMSDLNDKVVCDLGCGMGRWASVLMNKASPKALICVDFSDAIYECKNNLKDHNNVIFIKADILKHPFDNNFCDFMYCLGVLHHTTTPALKAVRALRSSSPQLLVYLYYSLDNRSVGYRSLFAFVNVVRKTLCSIKSNKFRLVASYVLAIMVYRPAVILGHILDIFGIGNSVPLYEFYKKKSIKRLAQDAYDRFFTSIEQRVSKLEILSLLDEFEDVQVSEGLPFWHFLLQR